MGRRPLHPNFKDHWHTKHLTLDDGRRLRWTIIDYPWDDLEPFLFATFVDDQGVWPGNFADILAEIGHPDATAYHHGLPERGKRAIDWHRQFRADDPL